MQSDQERDLFLTRRIWPCEFMLDANCINARQADSDLNRLEAWHKEQVISLVMADRSSKEAAVGDSVRKRKTYMYIQMITHITTPDERAMHRLIETILFPNGARSQREKNDALIVFNAKKYMHRLITRDGRSKKQPKGILGNAARLKAEIGLVVMRPDEAVEYVRESIQMRDKLTREYCSMFSVPLPLWVGAD